MVLYINHTDGMTALEPLSGQAQVFTCAEDSHLFVTQRQSVPLGIVLFDHEALVFDWFQVYNRTLLGTEPGLLLPIFQLLPQLDGLLR